MDSILTLFSPDQLSALQEAYAAVAQAGQSFLDFLAASCSIVIEDATL